MEVIDFDLQGYFGHFDWRILRDSACLRDKFECNWGTITNFTPNMHPGIPTAGIENGGLWPVHSRSLAHFNLELQETVFNITLVCWSRRARKYHTYQSAHLFTLIFMHSHERTNGTQQSCFTTIFPLAVSSPNTVYKLIAVFHKYCCYKKHGGIKTNLTLRNNWGCVTDVSKPHSAGIWRMD